jgi:putative tricarboxylic transport membrane protein
MAGDAVPPPAGAEGSGAAAPRRTQQLAAAGVLALAAVLGWGALSISSDAGYAGVGPNVLPWALAAALMVCGLALLRQALGAGFAAMPVPSGAARGDWRALAWMAAGLLANAALIERIGFVLACALCFVLAVRGLRVGAGRPGGGLRSTLADTATGLALALPVFWTFTLGLGVNLPGLTGTGWL